MKSRKTTSGGTVSTDWLLFEDAERGSDEDLKLQFEAMNQLTPDEKAVARAVLEGLLLKHVAHKWSALGLAERAQAATKQAIVPVAAVAAKAPATVAAKQLVKVAAKPLAKQAARAAAK